MTLQPIGKTGHSSLFPGSAHPEKQLSGKHQEVLQLHKMVSLEVHTWVPYHSLGSAFLSHLICPCQYAILDLSMGICRALAQPEQPKSRSSLRRSWIKVGCQVSSSATTAPGRRMQQDTGSQVKATWQEVTPVVSVMKASAENTLSWSATAP